MSWIQLKNLQSDPHKVYLFVARLVTLPVTYYDFGFPQFSVSFGLLIFITHKK